MMFPNPLLLTILAAQLAQTAYSAYEWCPNSLLKVKIDSIGVVCDRTDRPGATKMTCKALIFVYAAMAIILTFFLIMFLKMRKRQEDEYMA